jgi:hypothetical protein
VNPHRHAGERGFLPLDPGRRGVSPERERDAGDPHRREAVRNCGDGPARAARRRVLSDHRATVETVVRAADAVADDWDRGYATDRDDVVEPMATALSASGTDAALVRALADAVAAAGYALSADPVPAPPYLAVTGRGPILRGTVEDGRLVVEFRVFGVERTDEGPRYVRRGEGPDDLVTAEFRGSGGPA